MLVFASANLFESDFLRKVVWGRSSICHQNWKLGALEMSTESKLLCSRGSFQLSPRSWRAFHFYICTHTANATQGECTTAPPNNQPHQPTPRKRRRGPPRPPLTQGSKVLATTPNDVGFGCPGETGVLRHPMPSQLQMIRHPCRGVCIWGRGGGGGGEGTACSQHRVRSLAHWMTPLHAPAVSQGPCEAVVRPSSLPQRGLKGWAVVSPALTFSVSPAS